MTDAIPSTTMTGSEPAAARTTNSSTLIFVSVFAAETALLLFAGIGLLSSPMALVLHLLVVVAASIILRRRILSGIDGGITLLGVLGTLATGPFGAAGALLMPMLMRRDGGSNARLAAWYRRIALSAEQDEFTQLSDQVAIGRTANLAAPAPQALIGLFHSGALSAQQSALGMIARTFHPAYLPALKLALDSPEPVIRVQAAAVAARIRSQLKARVDTLVKRAANATISAAEATAIAAELDVAANSGLLEEIDTAEAFRIRLAVIARTMAAIDASRHPTILAGGIQASARTGAAIPEAYLAHLLAANRFAEFRALRTRLRRSTHGRYRLRLVLLRTRPMHRLSSGEAQ